MINDRRRFLRQTLVGSAALGLGLPGWPGTFAASVAAPEAASAATSAE